MSSRAAAALAAGTSSAVLIYALLRLAQRVLLTEPNPAEVLYSEHAGFFWRSWTAIYAGGMIALAARLASDRRPALAARLVSALVVAAAMALAVATIVAP